MNSLHPQRIVSEVERPLPASWFPLPGSLPRFPVPSRPRAGASAQLTPSALVASTTPGGTRTHDLRFRKPPLYPAELRAQMLIPQRLLRSLAAGHAARNALQPTPCRVGPLVRAPGGRRLATRPIILALARRHVKAGPRAPGIGDTRAIPALRKLAVREDSENDPLQRVQNEAAVPDRSTIERVKLSEQEQ